MIFYMGLMGLLLSFAMLAVPIFGNQVLVKNQPVPLAPWAWTFGATGAGLVATGAHMTLTWPLIDVPDPQCCRSINLMFGEPSLIFGLVLLATAGSLAWVGKKLEPLNTGQLVDLVQRTDVVRTAITAPAWLAAAGGALLIPMGIAGLVFQKFVPPPTEWYGFVGSFETYYVSFMYLAGGLACIVLPFGLTRRSLPLMRFSGFTLATVGVLLLILTLAGTFGHIELAEL